MVVPTYPEGVAATPCRCASTTIRLCESATLLGCQIYSRNTLLATAPADSAETFTVPHSAPRALWYREGGGRWPVRPRVRGVPLRAESRDGDNINQTPYGLRAISTRTMTRTHQVVLTLVVRWDSSRSQP